ncbi:MAG: ATP-binding protein [Candidatus Aenigmarchaeota archaeon]|nr:ATP-binding protein [Candidatus Aenigmarchaeota archaeon]
MKFYNRKKEIELLEQFSQKEGFKFIVVNGMRRIGKTRLLTEFLAKKDYAYIFVPRDKTASVFLQDIAVDLNIPEFTRISDLLKYLFDTKKYVFFDEFQNFHYMDKSIYSEFQKLIDEYKMKNKDIFLFVSGSSYSLMKKIFVDYAHPLYGRSDLQINLEELEFSTVNIILEDIGIKKFEDQIRFFCVFGGIPKYYESLSWQKYRDFERCITDMFFEERTSILMGEGKTLLISEFGAEYKIYFSVLEGIATGKTRLNEIASLFENKTNTASRYLDILRKEYGLVKRETPIIENPAKSRLGVYAIKNNFLKFWFAFVKRYEQFYEQGRIEEVKNIFLKNHNSYVGYVFEDICKQFLISRQMFKFTKIGRQWGRIPKAPKGADTYEIDLVALDDDKSNIWFFECKWMDLNLNQSLNILEKLKEKSKSVNWRLDNRIEKFGLIGRKIKDKDKLLADGYLVFDLDDFKERFK